MPSLIARLFQSGMAAVFARRLARANEDDLKKALATGRRPGAGDPPASLFRQFAVEVSEQDGQRIYTVRSRKPGPPRGQILYLHGGGYVNPPAFLHWWFIAKLVRTLGVECTVPRYPLAPEHTCETGIGFAGDVYRQLLDQHGPDHLLVMGDSAGGGLAVAMLQQAKTMPAGLILNSPWLDAGVSDPSQVEIERHEWLLNRLTLRTWGKWWGGSRDLSDPLVSPLFGDLSNLPPTLMFAGSADILVADARRLAAAAPDKVRYIEEEGLMHVYPVMPFFPETRRAWTEIERFAGARLLPRA